MKKLILSILILGAMLHPSFAGGRHGGGHPGGGFHGGHGGHFSHNHFGGGRDHDRFFGDRRGWRGGYFFNEVIIADDGCYQWDGRFWVLIDCD
jgi:hypothetical protein